MTQDYPRKRARIHDEDEAEPPMGDAQPCSSDADEQSPAGHCHDSDPSSSSDDAGSGDDYHTHDDSSSPLRPSKSNKKGHRASTSASATVVGGTEWESPIRYVRKGDSRTRTQAFMEALFAISPYGDRDLLTLAINYHGDHQLCHVIRRATPLFLVGLHIPNGFLELSFAL